MDNFIVSARKYRPVTFDSVVGQSHITNTLKNAIHNNQLAQAFLFCGPRGVGKTTCARILAKTINCEQISENTEACGECNSCRSFQNGNSFSIHELDAASNNSVEDIRSLIDQVRIPPQTGKYKIYIIDEVHMLSQQAFNAFLKTLEEPPSYAIFILATTEKHKILPTILSRCQIFDFNRIQVEDMANHLARIAKNEGISYENDGLHVIAQKADGGLRDALSMFDQIVSFSNKEVTYKAVIDNLNILDYDYYFDLLQYIVQQDAAQALLVFDKVLTNGFDGGHFIAGLSAHLRNLLVAKEPATLKLLEVGENIRKKYLEQSQQLNSGLLLSAMNIANQCEINYRTSKNHRLQVELALLKMCHIATAIRMSLTETSTEVDVKKKLTDKPADAVNTASVTNSRETETIAKPSPQSTSANPAPAAANPVAASVTETIGSNSNTITSGNNPSVAREAEVKPTPSRGWGAMPAKKLLPDLNTILDQKDEEEQENELLQGSEFAEVETEDFLKKWNAYAEFVKQENKITLYTIMSSSTPVLKDNIIEVEVENMVQMEEMKLGKVDILNHLRVQLRNYALEIREVVIEKTKVRKPYTSQEKYQAMVSKNPALETLRKKFNLGLS
ncbi:DNA polymerase III subunit gamma/tau [Sphingobacterium corticibacter]|uniref:DNA polymerase III subunit gamma/tau n=1 Tax=Sphingobacterium corticibacter TaxID=2171749 RepID=A0A2T8HEN3_9SPHI|nr:DNA polymerase III subunit gamma/tau [Sphingobacterium corticibacter]PVH23898.1 DNA polymerase III subunit gamma/tau [Sphingobacterium corticibacter]